MIRFIIKRLLSVLPVLIIVVTLVFFLMRIIPGDPATLMLGDDAAPEDILAFREMMGLNDPMLKQYINYVKDILTGDWGDSLYYKTPVFDNIMKRMEPTILLMLYSTFLSVSIGIPFGIIAAKRRNSIADYSLTTISIFGTSIPVFWLGIMMIYLFGVKMMWFPVQGYIPIEKGGLWKALYSLTMPSFALGFQHISSIARYTRSTMLDVMNNDYVRTARAKGLTETKVYYKHALKNSLAPVVTLVGFSMAGMLGGSVVTETVFNIPGMGKLAYDSLMRRDYTQEQAIILFVAIIFILTNILLDIIYKWLDPRIEFD
ncbi:MAG: ABC transporter permease [Clostridiaceae bacterium]|nr:ABC transporter permease [Clostridiaceae bacterium]